MDHSKKIRSLSDLDQFLPAAERPRSRQSDPIHPKKHDGKENIVHVTLETKGRKGKSVTVVSGMRHNPATMDEIARILKQHCGAGGTVKGGNIEIQGEQRMRVTEKLMELNYIVK